MNSSQFGNTKEQETARLETSNIKTAKWLMQKYVEEKEIDPVGGFIGLRLNDWHELETACNGLRKGLITIVAKSHVGKSTFLIDLARDAMQSNEDLKVVIYSLDDDKDEMRVMLISNLSQQYKNTVEVKRKTQIAEDKIHGAYLYLIKKSQENKFVIKDMEDGVDDIDDLIRDIEDEKKDCGRMLVLIDGFMNVTSQGKEGRMQHIYRANKIMR